MSGSTAQRGRWLRTLASAHRPKVRLVCFPHSGGSAATFLSWGPLLPADVELIAVQYPARADRFSEQPAGSVMEMARGAATELQRLPTVSATVLFGHSLGALVAFEVARLVGDLGELRRVVLQVSGSAAPAFAGGGKTHLLPDAQLWNTVCGFGGIEPEVASNADLRDIILPNLRADLRCNAEYRAPSGDDVPLTIPIKAFHGTSDPLASEEEVYAWKEVTDSEFQYVPRPGGHFHILRDTRQLVADLLDLPGTAP